MTELANFVERAGRLGLAPNLDPDCVEEQLALLGDQAQGWVGIKANMAVAGQLWTAGIPGRAKETARRDATVVKKLRQGGYVLVPGLAMDEAAFGATGINAHYGRCLNPLDGDLVVGGSSGGSAAAVAADLLSASLGSDTLGSVRIPAAYSGIFGFKPTAGLVGRSGVFPLSPSLDTVGILGKNLEQIASLLRVVSGFDPDDLASTHPPPVTDAVTEIQGLREICIGIPEPLNDVALDSSVRTCFEFTRDTIAKAGARTVSVPMTRWNPSACRKAALLLVEAEGAVALSEYMDQHGGLSTSVASAMNFGRSLSSAKLVAALAEMKAASMASASAFQCCDFIMMPTVPQPAFRFTETAPPNQADLTALANVCGLPALAIPVEGGHITQPGSIQLIGPAWSDWRLLHLAKVLKEAIEQSK